MRRAGDVDGCLKLARNGPPRASSPTGQVLSLPSLTFSPAIEIPVGTLTIRNLEDSLESRLRLRAAARNRSMEEEAREILRAALQGNVASTEDLGSRIRSRSRSRSAALGDIQLALEPREPPHEPPHEPPPFEDSPPAPRTKVRKLGAGRR